MYTLRAYNHKPYDVAFYHEKRNLVRIGRVNLSLKCIATTCADVERYVSESGFDKASEWFDLAVKIHGTSSLLLYETILVDSKSYIK